MTDLNILSEKLNLLINTTEEAILNIRKQHFWKTSYNIHALSNSLKEYFSLSAGIFDETVTANLLSYLQDMLKAQTDLNYVLLGDILEIHLLPSFYEMQGAVLSNLSLPEKDFFIENIHMLSDKNCKEPQKLSRILTEWYQSISDASSSKAQMFSQNYHIEPTNSGCLTLNKKAGNHFYYFHSNQNPQKEGRIFADSYALEDIFNYSVFGMGFGYHIGALLRKDARFHVTVLESDLNVLGAAFRSINLKYILTCMRAQIVYLPDISALGTYLSDTESRLIIHYPSLLALKDGPAKDSLKNYFIHLSSVYEQTQLLNENYYYNQKLKDSCVDIIKKKFENKTVIYIGGGLSAETKLSAVRKYISEHPKTITICAGTVYRKLLSLNFIPDYVMISDSQPALYRQLNDIQKTSTCLIYLSTASHNAVKVFHGMRYIAYQSDFAASEKTAGTNGYTLFSTGGSVSTLAIDLAIRFGCQTLITTGLDLSFPENKVHGFSLSNKASLSASLTVKDLHGKPVQTSQPLNSYRKWIEQRIQSEDTVEFINLTEGAYIQGMKNLENFVS